GQLHGRPAARQVDDAEIAPEDAAPEAGAERLRARLLGGIALGVARGAVGTPVRLRALDLGEDAQDEALAVALDRPLDPADVDEVGAGPDDHRRRLLRRALITRSSGLGSRP